jgi:predicted kinase
MAPARVAASAASSSCGKSAQRAKITSISTTEGRVNTLILTVGLPRSGKTSWTEGKYIPVVNPDAIRLALHGTAFIPDAEKMIWVIAHYMVKALFIAGHDTVVVDATNTTRKRREAWKGDDWVRKYHVIDTSKEECIARCAPDRSNRPDLIPIIEKMAEQFEPVEDDEWD